MCKASFAFFEKMDNDHIPPALFTPHFLRQMRAARALLGWTQQELADHSGVSLSTLNRFERDSGSPNLTSLRQIFQCFQKAGVAFAQHEDGAVGVYLTAEAVRRLDRAKRSGK